MNPKSIRIVFNRPSAVGKEIVYIKKALKNGHISGDGEFSKKCSELMEKKFGATKILLTTSGTHALEMAALLLDLKRGDEVIVPSYTFPSTVNAFALRGARPVFVDIREDTLNMDESLIERKITKNTKAIFVVHYAGIACQMDQIKKIAQRHGLYIVEDAAQGIGSKFKRQYLGTIGDFGAYSFHETKNLTCGEGGALVINNKKFIERAEIIREKGTNRSKFFRGEINKYGWVDIGSSYLPSDILAAFLYAQLENMEKIQNKRRKIYEYYRKKLMILEEKKYMRLPIIPGDCTSNYHMFYLILPNKKLRDGMMAYLKSKGIMAVFHYLPLHSSPQGRRMGNKKGDLPRTEDLSGRLMRLPFYYELTRREQDYIVRHIKNFFSMSS